MNIRITQRDDIDTLFEIRTGVIENQQSREEIAELGITSRSVAIILKTDCCAWVAEIDDRPIAFSIANAPEKTIFGIFVLPSFEGRGAGRALMRAAENWLWSKGDHQPKINPAQLASLIERTEENNDATLAEYYQLLQEKEQVSIAQSIMCVLLQRLNGK
jgi:GNAT superfamily N-acetyltransferase